MQPNISHQTATEFAAGTAYLSSAARPLAVTSSDVMPVVFVIDDEVSVRESLELLLGTEGWQVETFASAEDFLSRPRATVPCCLVLDVRLGGHSGLDLQRHLAGRTDIPIIFITGYNDISTTVQAMKAGAFDVQTKPLKTDVLIAAVRQALRHSHAALLDEARARAVRMCYASLTPREREVMALVVSGLLNKQVGGELGISEITVKAHRGQVMRKMKADSLAALVRMAARLGVGSMVTSDRACKDQYESLMDLPGRLAHSLPGNSRQGRIVTSLTAAEQADLRSSHEGWPLLRLRLTAPGGRRCTHGRIRNDSK